MSTAIATIENAGVEIDHQAILKTLNLNPRDPNTQALLLVCERYGLDPLLKHMVLIQGSPYITRDGYLAIAHRSGVFDGMEVVEQGADQTHYVARVSVWRKDMGRPFTFIGRYPKSQRMAKDYGPEMAVKVAEVQALRRAFNVTGVGAADERWDSNAEIVEREAPGGGGSMVRTRPQETREVAEAGSPDDMAPPSTGTRRRKPPTVPAADSQVADAEVAGEVAAAEVVGGDPPASEFQRADIAKAIERLVPATKTEVMRAWHDRGLPGFYVRGSHDPNPEFSAVHAAEALALLAEHAPQVSPAGDAA